MFKFVLVLVFMLDTGDIKVEKVEHSTVQNCLTQEKQFSEAFEKDDKVLQYVTGCFPFKVVEKT